MLVGRLGLEQARIPHADRHGLLWLARGHLFALEGSLRFLAAGGEGWESGEHQIPFQALSLILLGPGSVVSHDALRLMARHGVGMVAVGADGVRMYSAPPLGPDSSALARRQAALWAAGPQSRNQVARRMYAMRLGEIFPVKKDIAVLRGIEGARMKETYKVTAQRFGIPWHGRRYDRQNPGAADLPNQAINHAATAVEAAAMVATAATGAIPSLGFIHEDSGSAFVLDIADLFRDETTLPVAFGGVKRYEENPRIDLERHVRRLAGETFNRKGVIPRMIDRIKELCDAGDGDP